MRTSRSSSAVLLLGFVVAGLVGCTKSPLPAPPAVDAGAQAPAAEASPATDLVANNAASSTDASSTQPESRPAADAPVTKVTLREYYDAWQANGAESKRKYGKQWIETSGRVAQQGTMLAFDNKKHFFVILKLTEDKDGKPLGQFDLQAVRVFFDDPADWGKTSVGSQATIRGMLSNYFDGGLFESGTVVESQQAAAQLSAADLAAEVDKDPAAAKEKYDGKSVLVTGKLQTGKLADKRIGFCAIGATLAGTEPTSVGLAGDSDQNAEFADAKPGDEIRAIGVCRITPEPGESSVKVGLEEATRLDHLAK